ncbi:MAG TPA: putative glycoside hydrolase [Chloroflexota bacterium]|nr:putative glycoside hydrolase [Chloroflexota bacterium]
MRNKMHVLGRRFALALAVITGLVGPGVLRPLSPTYAALTPLPDTTNNIHLAMAFNGEVPHTCNSSPYNCTPNYNPNNIEYVWGSGYQTEPAGVVNDVYMQFDREPNNFTSMQTGLGFVNHPLSWFQANHPDWIEYKCDKTTVDTYDGQSNTPLDISNAGVLNYLWNTYYLPTLNLGFHGIAFDNVNVGNNHNRCGHYDLNGHWVQQFTGGRNDPAYIAAVTTWAQFMQQHVHALGKTVAYNYPFDPYVNATDWMNLTQYMDIDFDECGFTVCDSVNPPYVTDSTWLNTMNAYAQLAQTKGWVSNNDEPDAQPNFSRSEIQWVLANYLLMKGPHTFVWMTGPASNNYGHQANLAEYSAPIGSATNSMYQSQNVWMRDFSNGKAIVNPSSRATYSISLPANTYKDLYGNAMNSVTLGPASGIVLLGTGTGPTTTPAPATATNTPATTSVPPTSTPPPAPTATRTTNSCTMWPCWPFLFM